MKVNELKAILNDSEYPDDAEVVIETSGGFRAKVSGVWPEDDFILKTIQIP